jgi:cell fate regulator YaaT (PSP1 superfamily)
MCCLAYECETYTELRKHLPRPGTTLNLPEGKGKVKSVATLTGKITCELADGQLKNYNWTDLQETNR